MTVQYWHWVVLTVLSIVLISPSMAKAAWPPNAFDAVPICTEVGEQLFAQSVTDGAGGVITVWRDARGATLDIYVQRVDAAGNPLWTPNGVAICTAPGTQTKPIIVADGQGGAIVAWQDDRDVGVTGTDIYAQRVNSTGTPLWAADGVALCVAVDSQILPNFPSEGRGSSAIVSDTAGGAIVVWQDDRALAMTSTDIYAQRVSALGVPLWAVNGVALCAVAPMQFDPAIIQDGLGGAIATWVDNRSGTVTDIFAQRVSAGGAVAWLANGLPVAFFIAGEQSEPVIAADGVGGAIIAWEDNRVAATEIYATRLNPAGTITWGPNPICTAGDLQLNPAILSDGVGGAIIAWEDHRDLLWDVYAQRVGFTGAVQWTVNGVAITTILGGEGFPSLVSDGANGAILSWEDSRGDLYARRISAAGVPMWAADGVAVSSAQGSPGSENIVADGTGGAILAWLDDRRLATAIDVLAQRIDRYGYVGDPAASIEGVDDVPNDQGGRVKLSWNRSYLDQEPTVTIDNYRIWRSVPPGAFKISDSRSLETDPDLAATTGKLLVTTIVTTTYYWEYLATQTAAQLPGYSYVAATTGDSVAGSNPTTAFMIEARNLAGTLHWFSLPGSGYSVDNLAPGVPKPFTADYPNGVAALHWNPNMEVDFAEYRLHRGTIVDFVPGPGNFLQALADTGFVDSDGQFFYYKLSAVDLHGNESPFAQLVPPEVSGIADRAAFSLLGPFPNPATIGTTITFSLPGSGPISLIVLDARGRKVRTLRQGWFAPGKHVVSFDLHDDEGRKLASGVYLVRLEVAGKRLIRRLTTIQ